MQFITMKNKILLLFALFLFGSVTAQEKKLIRADRDYDRLNYVSAQKIYLEVAEKGYESEEIFTKLANSFYFNAQYDEAARWYGRLFDLNPEPQEKLLFLRYSQALKATGKPEEAQDYYNSYIKMTSRDPMARTAVDYMALIRENSGRYDFEPVAGLFDNSRVSFGSSIRDNTLIFAATVNTHTFLNRRNAWDGLSFLSLYEAAIDEEGQLAGKPSRLKGSFKDKFHQSSAVFTKDGNTIYFTASNQTSEKGNRDTNLKIYRAVRQNGKWQEAEELPINSDHFSTAHPALSPDETVLYFASNRPGGYGQSDLYKADIFEDGSLGRPVNLGPEINTPGKETFPFITKNNELYFSSDGHFGLGGLDVFYVEIKRNGFGNLLNVGEPVNSYADDFAFGIDTETQRGFVSSNRTDSPGKFVHDNIYTFREHTIITDVFFAEIEGYVTDKHSGEPLAAATIHFFLPDGSLYKKIRTDASGYYHAEINKFMTYTIRAEKDGYDTDEKISTAGKDSQQIDFRLQKDMEELQPGVDLAKVLNIPTIYFDFDKFDIRPDAQVELQKVLTLLEQYPQLKLAIRSHTDSRGSDAYNLVLSEKRAAATRAYLVSKGIGADRLKAEGLGETELVNRCANGVPCSEKEHQENRRSEFIILE